VAECGFALDGNEPPGSAIGATKETSNDSPTWRHHRRFAAICSDFNLDLCPVLRYFLMTTRHSLRGRCRKTVSRYQDAARLTTHYVRPAWPAAGNISPYSAGVDAHHSLPKLIRTRDTVGSRRIAVSGFRAKIRDGKTMLSIA